MVCVFLFLLAAGLKEGLKKAEGVLNTAESPEEVCGLRGAELASVVKGLKWVQQC